MDESIGPDTSTAPIDPNELPDVPSILRLDELESEHETLAQKEASFKTFLINNLLNIDLNTIRPTLLQWIAQGYPDSYRLLTIQVPLPGSVCSDGVPRGLYEFISFCAGMPFQDIMSTLQQRLIGMNVGYITEGMSFSVVVSKS